ncbi:MAG: CPBP family intramembrane metalloprotease [Bacteroidia bacterium]|nr:CPBP family intramembrane metalloprotease [Bacteroidia bacterium]
MNISLAWNPDFLPPVLGISVALLGFIIYWFIADSGWLRSYLEKKYGERGLDIIRPLTQKYLGVIWMGIVPTIVMLSVLPYTWHEYAVQAGDLGFTAAWSIGLSAALVLMNWFAARRPETLAYYPQVRAKIWTKKLLFHNSLAWILYLLAYEFLFRGLLLFSCLYVLDPWVAISINIALYSATHLPKGFTESLVTIPFGIGMCLLTIYSGGIWIAWIAHVAVALSNDYVALRFNPEMKVVKG